MKTVTLLAHLFLSAVTILPADSAEIETKQEKQNIHLQGSLGLTYNIRALENFLQSDHDIPKNLPDLISRTKLIESAKSEEIFYSLPGLYLYKSQKAMFEDKLREVTPEQAQIITSFIQRIKNGVISDQRYELDLLPAVIENEKLTYGEFDAHHLDCLVLQLLSETNENFYYNTSDERLDKPFEFKQTSKELLEALLDHNVVQGKLPTKLTELWQIQLQWYKERFPNIDTIVIGEGKSFDGHGRFMNALYIDGSPFSNPHIMADIRNSDFQQLLIDTFDGKLKRFIDTTNCRLFARDTSLFSFVGKLLDENGFRYFTWGLNTELQGVLNKLTSYGFEVDKLPEDMFPGNQNRQIMKLKKL